MLEVKPVWVRVFQQFLVLLNYGLLRLKWSWFLCRCFLVHGYWLGYQPLFFFMLKYGMNRSFILSMKWYLTAWFFNHFQSQIRDIHGIFKFLSFLWPSLSLSLLHPLARILEHVIKILADLLFIWGSGSNWQLDRSWIQFRDV